MAKYGGKDIGFALIDGISMLAAKLQSIRHKITVEQEATGGLGDAWEESTPTGTRASEFAQEGGYFDTTATTGSHAIFTPGAGAVDPNGTPRLVCISEAGNVIGRPFTGFQGLFQGDYEVLSTVRKLTRANVSWKVSGAVDDGEILHALSQDTAAGNTQASSVDNTAVPQRAIPITSSSVANPSTITCPVPHYLTTGDTVLIAGHTGSTPSINGEQTVTVTGANTFTIPVNVTVGGTGGTFTRGKTNNGGVAYLQVTQLVLGGYTNWVVKVRHSVDNITFADLATFTVRTAIGAERLPVVAGTAVNRYLATSVALTGAGSGPSITCMVGFARK